MGPTCSLVHFQQRNLRSCSVRARADAGRGIGHSVGFWLVKLREDNYRTPHHAGSFRQHGSTQAQKLPARVLSRDCLHSRFIFRLSWLLKAMSCYSGVDTQPRMNSGVALRATYEFIHVSLAKDRSVYTKLAHCATWYTILFQLQGQVPNSSEDQNEGSGPTVWRTQGTAMRSRFNAKDGR